MEGGDNVLVKLRNARMAAGLTQAEMGKKLGLTMAGYRQKESGERKISIQEANQIVQILGLTLDDIFLDLIQSN